MWKHLIRQPWFWLLAVVLLLLAGYVAVRLDVQYAMDAQAVQSQRVAPAPPATGARQP